MSRQAQYLVAPSSRHPLVTDTVKAPAEYGHTDAGTVPNEWSVMPLGSLLSDGRLGGNYPNREVETDFPLMKMGNVARGYFDVSKFEFIESRVTPDEQHRLVVGDVLFNTRNTLDLVGKVAIWRDELPVAFFNSNLMRLGFDPCKICSNAYANYSLNTRESITRLRALATGTTSVAAIYTRDLLRLPFAVPPLAEQFAIAEVLSDVDELLAALDALIAKKRAIKQASMQQLLTGNIRLPGFSGEWRTRRLGDYLTFLRHGVNSRAELTTDGPVKYLHYGDIHTTTDVYLDPCTSQMPRLPEKRAKMLDRLQDGDLVLVDASEDLDGIGKSVEIKGAAGNEVVSGLHTITARFDKAMLADGFKAYLQFCPTFRDHLRRLAAGTKVFATNRAHVATVEMPLPRLEEQIGIATVLGNMDTEIIVLKARREKTRDIKQGIMQQLLTGRIRLVKPMPEKTAA